MIKLTEFEIQVIKRTTNGDGDKEIALALNTTVNNVSTARSRIYKKIGIKANIILLTHWSISRQYIALKEF